MAQDLRHFTIPQQRPRRLDDRKKAAITTALLLIIIVVFVWAFGPWQNRHAGGPVSGSEPSTAVRAAESFGFTSVRITKTSHMGGALSPCDENDSTVHEAVATNLRDRDVTLLICCNATNDCTVKVAH